MKKINISWFEIIFLLLYPGFFFYHALLARNIIPAFLGGFFGYISLISFPFAVVYFIRQLVRREVILNKIDVLFFFIVLYSVCVICINYVFGLKLNYKEELFANSLSDVVLCLLMYFIGRGITLKNKLFSKILTIFLLIMSLIAVVNIGDSGIFYLAQEAGSEEGVATYQGFGRSLLVSAIFSLVLVEKRIYFTVIAAVSFVALFVNGARTEFMGFILYLIVLSFIRFSTFSFIGLVVLVVLVLFPIILLLPDVVFENSRVFELFKINESSSYIARSEFSGDAIRTILSNPIFGDYGSYVKLGEIGSGAHNILSAWVDFGIVGFFSYVILLISMMYVLYRYRELLAGNKYFWLASGLFLYLIFALLTSKDHSYLLVGMTVGFVSRLPNIRLFESINYNKFARLDFK